MKTQFPNINLSPVISADTELRYMALSAMWNSLQAARWYLEQLQDTLAPRSLKSHVVAPFGTSFLGVASVG